jgi:aldose 1-epimerase
MARYSAERGNLDKFETVALHDRERDVGVRIARRGATVLGIGAVVNGKPRELADGYRDEAELETRPSSRFAVMAPFANRIDDARYTFDGVEHDLQPGVEGAERASRHGFLRGVDFDIDQVAADTEGAHATFASRAIRPGVHPGYPFAVDFSLRYTLDAQGLALEATMRNVGDAAAPCFFGWHPYFRVAAGEVDGWELTIPARSLIVTGENLIPLPGAAAYAPAASRPELDFRTARPIGAVKLDQGYADLEPDADGLIRSRLRDPASGLALTVWQERGILLAFTADTVVRDPRRSVALEPMESMSNAFNRPDCAEAIRLEPGAERRFRCGVAIELP